MKHDAPPAGRPPNEDEMTPKDFSDAARLMAQPIAGAAVLSAIGIGMATQAFGFWLTAVSSAMQGSRAAPVDNGPAADPIKSRAEAAAPVSQAPASPLADGSAKVVKFVSRAERAEKAARAPKRKPVSKTAKPATKPHARTDDLKAISGIGPKLESVLNGLGFRTYAQIAALTPTEIAQVEEDLGFKGRIGRDDWIGQAKVLMARGSA